MTFDERDPLGSSHFAEARRSARETVRDPSRVADLLDAATEKADRWAEKRSVFKKVYGQFHALARMIRAYYKKEYRDVPWETILVAVAAITYFVMPVDVIPDFIVGLGFFDDAAVLTLVIATIRVDLEKFLHWERSRPIDVEALPKP